MHGSSSASDLSIPPRASHPACRIKSGTGSLHRLSASSSMQSMFGRQVRSGRASTTGFSFSLADHARTSTSMAEADQVDKVRTLAHSCPAILARSRPDPHRADRARTPPSPRELPPPGAGVPRRRPSALPHPADPGRGRPGHVRPRKCDPALLEAEARSVHLWPLGSVRLPGAHHQEERDAGPRRVRRVVEKMSAVGSRAEPTTFLRGCMR